MSGDASGHRQRAVMASDAEWEMVGRVHEYPDGTLAVFHGPRCLARYQTDGEPIDTPTRQAA